jgi:LuxR family transcriptional regulator, maltose regulon positive regulatory protein
MTPILATKLYLPRPRPNFVSRPRLIERLNNGLHHKLTLLSAPAGFGKTTLVSEWLTGCGWPVAWLSLEKEENDLSRFLTYLVAALQTISASLGEGVLELFQSSQPPPFEAILTALINDLIALPDHFVLVLDDYHVIDTKPVDMALTYLVEHLPPQMHLVMATREDPDIPLARLRARWQLTELRAADLRFTTSEAVAFLNHAMNLNLSIADITRLADRTEGWIAGLQLAALSLQGHQDISGFVQAFAGDHWYIMDYLVEEVLHRQPESIRNFLLQTSILERLNGSLCAAITGQDDSHERLEALERGNFFVVPLDDKRHWYRYHHLFAEVLYAHLLEEQPSQISSLHRRASAWYEQHDAVDHAIHHSLSAADFERAADLIERTLPVMRRDRQDMTLLNWFKALPDSLVHFRPVLSVGYAYALLSAGKPEAANARLQDAERWLDAETDMDEMIVVNEEEFGRLPGAIAVYHAAIAHVLGNIPDAVKYARQALDILPEEDHLVRGAAAALLGLAFWSGGDLVAAYRSFADGIASVQMSGNISDAISGTIALADILIAQGHLHEAMHIYERSLQFATKLGEPVLQGMADLYVGMSELYWEHNDLDAATEYLLISKELGERTALPQNWSRWHVAMARIREAQGDLDGALSLLDEAERLYMRGFFPDIRPVAALRARVWARQGRLGESISWAREQGLEVSDELSYLREFEHITLARVLLTQCTSDRTDRFIFEAMDLLDRLLKAAEAGERMTTAIEILLLQAIAYQMQGNIPAALMPLQRALMLAEPEGYIRIFVGEGPLVATLLEEAAKHGIALNYTRQLLAAMGSIEDRTPIKQGLIEPLSERELEVLRLLGTDLSGPEIARELIVSLNTMRTHTKNIYSKLGVNNRRAALRRAEELDLL